MVPGPTLILFLARHCLLGIATGWAALVVLDVAHLGKLLLTSEDWLLTLALAAVGFAVTFGSLAMGTAIFLLPRR